jgi:hypothetical protein
MARQVFRGRMRLSTLLLIGLFLVTLSTYLLVRPVPASILNKSHTPSPSPSASPSASPSPAPSRVSPRPSGPSPVPSAPTPRPGRSGATPAPDHPAAPNSVAPTT